MIKGETNWWRAWEAKSPNTVCVFLSPLSIGVPVKPMNDALGNASRMCLANQRDCARNVADTVVSPTCNAFQIDPAGNNFYLSLVKEGERLFMALLLKVNWVDQAEHQNPYLRIRHIGGAAG